MTQQLKFGDRVRCKQTGAEGLIIDTGKTDRLKRIPLSAQV